MSIIPYHCPFCNLHRDGPCTRTELSSGQKISKEQIEKLRKEMELDKQKKLNCTSKLPDHTFKKGEWYWCGKWHQASYDFNRKSYGEESVMSAYLTVDQAAKLGLTPPRERKKVKGWKAIYDGYCTLSPSLEEIKLMCPSASEYIYLEECDPPEEE